MEVHHILAEIIQGGLVLETNVEEIDSSGSSHASRAQYVGLRSLHVVWRMRFDTRSDTPSTRILSVQAAAKARRESFTSANPLSLGVGGGVAPRNGGLQTPLGWLTGKITGVGAR